MNSSDPGSAALHRGRQPRRHHGVTAPSGRFHIGAPSDTSQPPAIIPPWPLTCTCTLFCSCLAHIVPVILFRGGMLRGDAECCRM